jgi:hypothetical protein
LAISSIGVEELEKPDLNKMWRTWVKIGLKSQLTHKMLPDTIRHKMYNISQLQKMGKITWYYFLYHDKTDDPSNGYFDTVFTVGMENPNEFLPEYCIDTKKIPPMKEIYGIDASILNDKDIAEAWRIIGEQSEFIINLVSAHTENSEIHRQQIAQFMHYFMNPLGLGLKSILFFPKIPSQIIWQMQVMPEEMKENCLRF